MKITPQSLLELRMRAKKQEKINAAFFRQLASRQSNKVDEAFRKLHVEVFNETDCLECGNCCKTLGPRITDADVRRISAALKIKPSVLTEKHLHLDEDNDNVFRKMPCPFLGIDNYCSIYENRPRACREYPHTDRRRMQQILDLTFKNIETCPAVYEIVERLKNVKL